MKTLAKLMGPQIYGTTGKLADKYIEVSISINRLRTSPIVNFTGFSWCDQKYGFAMSMLRNSWCKTIVHDSDYLGLAEYAEVLKERDHEVVFILNKREFSVRNISDRTNGHFSTASASNKRIRKAFEKLKSAGVRVRKFRTLATLERYLIAKAKGGAK